MILKSCATCIIYGVEAEIMVKARVSFTEYAITLYFEDDSELGNQTDRLQVDFFDSQVGYIKTFSELEVRKNTDPNILEPWIADCKILEIIQIIQRQEELRVRMEKEASFLSPARGRFKGIIQNISVGGLYVTTDMQMNANEHFEFEYTFMKKPQEVKAKILRVTTVRDNYYGYGCQFVHLSRNAERDIRQFVFKQQLHK